MKTTMMIAGALALAMTTPALANDMGPEGSKEVKAKFEAADMNKDGTLDSSEWGKAWPEKQDWFERADTNKDKKVTLAEKQALHAAKEADKDHDHM